MIDLMFLVGVQDRWDAVANESLPFLENERTE